MYMQQYVVYIFEWVTLMQYDSLQRFVKTAMMWVIWPLRGSIQSFA